jgi:hypothetical protein
MSGIFPHLGYLYPFYFVGTAPSRYIVHATLAAADDLRSSEMPGQAAKAH